VSRGPGVWDYLIVTASNRSQALAYEAQLRLRQQLDLLPQVRRVEVVADLEGKRIGSGGSTVYAIAQVLNFERPATPADFQDTAAITAILRDLRILIVHAGGDSRRLPAYGPCGKIFVPVPGESQTGLAMTLFDRLAPVFLDLPEGLPGQGQIVVAAGDALIQFDASSVRFPDRGMTALACYAAPEEASRHGVFCLEAGHAITLYLQKPSLAEQQASGAINRFGKTALDVGIMSLDAAAAAVLLRTFGSAPLLSRGVDLYREICCAMGSAATLDRYVKSARASGSAWSYEMLADVFPALRQIPFHVQVLPRCGFLHFGSTRQLVASGLALTMHDQGIAPAITTLPVNNALADGGSIAGPDSWVEGCRISAPLDLAGCNVVVGVDIREPMSLPRKACLDVLHGWDRCGAGIWFVRCYGIDDTFKDAVSQGARFCGLPLAEWIAAVGADPRDIWPSTVDPPDRSLWNARVFPAETAADGFRNWLWMWAPESATAAQKEAWLSADRYSAAESALLADHQAFHARRHAIRAGEIQRSLSHLFSRESAFASKDLAFAIAHSPDPSSLVARALEFAESYRGSLDDFTFCRVLHSLASAIGEVAESSALDLRSLVPPKACATAFRHLNDTILRSSMSAIERPRNVLRADETIWGRGPARLELGGGWTDTPPYTLEHGGEVVNTAVNLNGQPPIHCYCRVIEEPVIRLSSIDDGTHIEITSLAELLEYRRPGDIFALAKAALAIAGFSPEMANWPEGASLREMLTEFGGGIELTTFVGIPKGSGLGASSILGAVITTVIRRMLGQPPNQRELFHLVLRLEQALTTGGGWQDQIGGGVGGTKITSTARGMFPDPRIHYIPSDVLDPKENGGATLLYYTGLHRLANNILQQIVGGYLNRDRAIMAALAEERHVARNIADAMSRKDAAAFGHFVDVAWELQKRLCGTVTNETIEDLLRKVRPRVHGMRISGAGGGGFLIMIAKSPRDAAEVRAMLEREPLNERSRFFDFEINHKGIEVTTC
jgi:fucokinase